jgi:uncharacterized membrane protein YkvA (DUF1232 family)
MKGIAVGIIAFLCIVYLMMPNGGLIEFIPDPIPFIGNLDEATVTAILLACARYFGFDLSRFFGKKGEDDTGAVVDVDADEVRR